MIRKNNNQNRNNMKHRGGQGGRRYQSGNNRGGHHNDGQNLTRQKHHATQMREKFSNMARDAQNNGDRVDVEYYLQHVEHYSRVLTDIAVIEAERFAHQREQHAAQPTEQQDISSTGESDGTHEAAPHHDTGSEAPVSNQPRMTRQHHHRRHSEQSASADATSGEPTNGNAEIPLPGSVLPQI